VSDPRDAAVEALAVAINYGELDGLNAKDEWYATPRAIADEALAQLERDPARARAVVAALLTEEVLAQALFATMHERLRGGADGLGLGSHEADAAAILAALRSPDPADA
jgi:hypothetical protein